MKTFVVLGLVLFSFSGYSQTKASSHIHQLRMYEINKSTKQAFHDRFRDDAMRIMKKYNFKILSIWESESGDKTRFIYLLEWPDEKVMIDSWIKFKADEEWIAIKKKTDPKGEFVNGIEEHTLKMMDYSPVGKAIN